MLSVFGRLRGAGGLLAAVWLLAGLAVSPAMAGDGEVLHVGETTTLHLEGQSWVLDGRRASWR
jgi:hypothetical protein